MSLHLPDTSVWLATVVSGHVHHHAAAAWLDTVDSSESVVFCRATQQSFLRLLSQASVHAPYGDPPLSNDSAWDAYESLIADDRIVFQPDEPVGIEQYWKEYSRRATASPKLWMDAYLAAFARATDYRLVTTDAAFRQFAGLDLVLLSAVSG